MKTTVVGSYPVPGWLRMHSTRESLRDAIMAIIKTQELAGIEVVADGELYRWDINHAETNGMIEYFIRPLDGVASKLTRKQLDDWRSKPGNAFRAKPPGIVVDTLGPGTLDLEEDYALYRDLSDLPKKFTLTSPYMLAKMVADDHYHDIDALVMALADVLRDQVGRLDADVVQIDEANLTGHPEGADVTARAINHILGAVRGEKAVHLCYGNYGGQTIQDGTYDKLLTFLNTLEVDHLVLELARRPAEELALLKEIRSDIGLGIGVIDIKDNAIESPNLVARRIAEVADTVGVERIRYVHPDCGFWMLPRSVSDGKMQALVAGRNLFCGT